MSRQRDWAPPGSVPPRDKGWARALRGGLRLPKIGGSPQSSLGSLRGPALGAWGRGPGRPPLPRRAPGDLLIKTSTLSRCRSVSYLCATAAAGPAAQAAPKYCRNGSSSAALKIPDKESRNSRFPTSQPLVPAPAPPPAAASRRRRRRSDSTSRPRETAHALPDSGVAGAPIPDPPGRVPPAAEPRGWRGSPNPEPARREGPLIGRLCGSEPPVARTSASPSIKGGCFSLAGLGSHFGAGAPGRLLWGREVSLRRSLE